MLIDQISNLSSIYHKTAEEWREQQGKYDKRLAAAQNPAAAAEEVKAEPAKPAAREDRKNKKKTAPKAQPEMQDESSEEEKKDEAKPKKSKKTKVEVESEEESA